MREAPGRFVKPSFLPLYFLAFTGDLLDSLLIVACVLVGTREGLSGAYTGALAAAYGATYAFSPALLGRVSDRIGRKNSLLVAAGGFTCIAITLLLFHSNFWVLIAGECGVGILYGLWWCSIEAYISENATPASHQAKMNNFCISWSMGYMLGPFLGNILSGMDPIVSFWILLLVPAANMVVIALAIPVRHGVPNAHHEPEKASESVVDAQLGIKNIALASAILVFAVFSYAFAKSFFISLFNDVAQSPKYDLNMTFVQVAILQLAFGMARTITFIFQNRIKSTVIFTRVALALAVSLTTFLYAVTRSFTAYIFLFIAMGVFTGLLYTMTLELLMQINRAAKGKTAGFFEASIGLGTFLSPVVGGAVLQVTGQAMTTFFVIAVVSTAFACVSLGIYALFARAERKT